MSTYSAGYNFNPKDTVWILNNQTILEGVCVQTNIQIIDDINGNPQSTVNYVVLLNCSAGTMTVDDSDAYPTLQAALNALQTYLSTLVCPPVPTCLPEPQPWDQRSSNTYDSYEDHFCHRCHDE